MAVSLAFDSVSLAFQNYLQGIQNLKMVNFMNFADIFFVLIITPYILGIYFGSMEIMASVAVGKLILVLIISAVVYLRKKDCLLHLKIICSCLKILVALRNIIFIQEE
ncbi:MAG: hypothetical protein IJK81_03020 [Selenomonadaceae bacterium]|nr:hypothetical protein [Selenomonadaceae bacterium]